MAGGCRPEGGFHEWLLHAVNGDIEEVVVRTWQHGEAEEYGVQEYWRPATLAHHNTKATPPPKEPKRRKGRRAENMQPGA